MLGIGTRADLFAAKGGRYFGDAWSAAWYSGFL
jgi:hypothetical protein